MRAFEVGRDQLVEAVFAGFQDVAALALSGAGVVDEQVEAFETLAGVADEGLAISGGGDVTGENIGAGIGSQALGGVAASAIGSDHLVGAGKLGRDGAPDAAAGAGDQGGHWGTALGI